MNGPPMPYSNAAIATATTPTTLVAAKPFQMPISVSTPTMPTARPAICLPETFSPRKTNSNASTVATGVNAFIMPANADET